jgi:hypothetical protein
LITAAVRTVAAVAHNAAGSNMADGAVAALAEQPHAAWAVLEVDELHLAAVAPQCAPTAVVLLNLSRDQLDRSSEVRRIAATIGSTLARLPSTTVFANADDPMTVWAASQSAGQTVWIAAGCSWSGDAATCPACGSLLICDPAGPQIGWRCQCGLARPRPDWWFSGEQACSTDTRATLRPALPGRFNLQNALFALAVANHEGVDSDAATNAMCGVEQIAGRYARVGHGPHTLRTLLAKNPAGWAATLSMLTEPRPVVIVICCRTVVAMTARGYSTSPPCLGADAQSAPSSHNVSYPRSDSAAASKTTTEPPRSDPVQSPSAGSSAASATDEAATAPKPTTGYSPNTSSAPTYTDLSSPETQHSPITSWSGPSATRCPRSNYPNKQHSAPATSIAPACADRRAGRGHRAHAAWRWPS